MPDTTLLKKPHRDVLTEIANNSEVQDLIAGALNARERLLDKVIAMAGERGVTFKKVPEHPIVEKVSAEANIAKSEWDRDLTQWLSSKNITWSRLAVG